MQDTRLRDSISNAVVRLFRHVNRTHNRALRRHDISAEQVHVLQVLWAGGAMPVGRLQRFLALGSATMTGAIDRMERAGLVRRRPDPDDRRSTLLESGKMAPARRRAIDATCEQTEAGCFAGLTAKERRQLLALLQKAIEGFEAADG